MAKRRLGKGIDALIQGRELDEETQRSAVVAVPVDRIRANPEQPRTQFSEELLAELTESVREKGIIQPILAEEAEDGTYLIIAGERRFRAAQRAGLSSVPVLPRRFSHDEKLEIALIENLQREDLNPIDEAEAYRSLMESASLTQDELSRRLGLNRSTVANALRLLRLPEDLKADIAGGRLSAGHARAILAVDNDEGRSRLAERIRTESLSVRQAEELAVTLSSAAGKRRRAGKAGAGEYDGGKSGAGESGGAGTDRRKSPELRALEERLLDILGTKVTVKGSHSRGRIEIEYYSLDDLERIAGIIAGDAADDAGGE
ncbi:MAG: ParB/RepB/Spo0J family partition protein [Spirochaetaceae bacterium]